MRERKWEDKIYNWQFYLNVYMHTTERKYDYCNLVSNKKKMFDFMRYFSYFSSDILFHRILIKLYEHGIKQDDHSFLEQQQEK